MWIMTDGEFCAKSVSVSGNLVKNATVRNWDIFETG